MKTYCLTSIIVVIQLLCANGMHAQNTQSKTKEMVVAYELAGMNEVIVKKDIPYLKTSDSTLKMDIYYPPNFDFKSKIPSIKVLHYNQSLLLSCDRNHNANIVPL